MSDRIAPEWVHRAPYWYYTHIEMGSPDLITVRRAAADQQVSDRSPGTTVLRIHPHPTAERHRSLELTDSSAAASDQKDS
jgi:hypothetical protein